jgi:hypothetical protein
MTQTSLVKRRSEKAGHCKFAGTRAQRPIIALMFVSAPVFRGKERIGHLVLRNPALRRLMRGAACPVAIIIPARVDGRPHRGLRHSAPV